MVSIAVKTFGVGDFSRLAVTDWRLRRWRLWFSALMTSTQESLPDSSTSFQLLTSAICRESWTTVGPRRRKHYEDLGSSGLVP